MADQPPLSAKNSGDFHYANQQRFSDQALDLICCCALFTTLDTLAVSSFFHGDVQASEIRACFYKMVDDNHPIYLHWSHTHPLDHLRAINHILEPIERAEMDYTFQYHWHRQTRHAIPYWGRMD
ncbi:hypothetical protein MMC29_003094 [Sticta canariensis]|nr:hypothetical protein [Sticta canariensis]